MVTHIYVALRWQGRLLRVTWRIRDVWVLVRIYGYDFGIYILFFLKPGADLRG